MVRKVDGQEPEGRAGESRLARWSRLKSEAAAEKQPKPETMTAARVPAETAPAPNEDEQQKKVGEATKDLPPIESLGKDSDYTLFMREGVPEDMRTAALRKLWRSDPAFTEPFPFEMHMEDYNKTFVPINAATDTLYRAGLGYLFDDDKAKAGTAGNREGGNTPGPTLNETESTASRNPVESLSSASGEKIEIANVHWTLDEAGERRADEKISMSGKKKRD